MMNENSPICARLMPAWIAVRVPLPVRNAPIATLAILPPTTIPERTTTAPQCFSNSAGSIESPTETKKIATNMSRTGSTSDST